MSDLARWMEWLGDVLDYVFTAPNIDDEHGDPSNVVDGLFAIARAIEGLTEVLRGKEESGVKGVVEDPGFGEMFDSQVAAEALRGKEEESGVEVVVEDPGFGETFDSQVAAEEET